MINGKRDEKED